VRIVRSCHELGFRAVAVYSPVDRRARHVILSDEAYALPGNEPAASYLNSAALLEIARRARVNAVHPGYGFLSENPAFAEICRACGITFIGPAPEAIRLMGDKAQAREMAKHAGAPVVPGSEGPLAGVDEAQALADAIGYPVIVKAAAGGGGRGMRIVREREALARACAEIGGEQDLTTVVQPLERRAGVEVRATKGKG